MVVRLDGGQNQIGSGIVVLTAYPVEKNNQQTGKGQQVNEYTMCRSGISKFPTRDMTSTSS